MPETKTTAQAKKAKSPSTQAGEYVREEIEHVREGKHGARSTKQAIAIGLSKARRAGVRLRPPKRGATSERTRRSAETAYERGGSSSARRRRPSPRRSRATRAALRREGRVAASRPALARQARSSAARRGPRARSDAAQKAVRTKGPAARKAAARKAARTRAAHRSR
jgi:hypothetical protein